MDIDSATFLKQLEDCSLPPSQFNHIGHIFAGWSYLNEYPLDIAIEKTANSIQQLALSLGAKEKFHKTLTDAAVYIISARRQGNSDQDFKEFLSANEDLVKDFPKVIQTHYSKDLLGSIEAKTNYMKPDIMDF